MPCYGVGPHRHGINFKTIPLEKPEWPDAYREDPDCPGMGVYWCHACGEGKPDDIEDTP